VGAATSQEQNVSDGQPQYGVTCCVVANVIVKDVHLLDRSHMRSSQPSPQLYYCINCQDVVTVSAYGQARFRDINSSYYKGTAPMDNKRYRVVRGFHSYNWTTVLLRWFTRAFFVTLGKDDVAILISTVYTGFNVISMLLTTMRSLDILYSLLWWCYRTRAICLGQNNPPKRSHDENDECRCFFIHLRPKLIHFVS
jgi:hypothetical protein